jgi:serine/threonine protein kinase
LRFRILRPHAKGGLGEVFVARDEELRRDVALKEIRGSRADDPQSWARFLLEAELTGGLEHPGVVPVYGLGTYADGRPFYAMRFVRGDSLQDATERFHRPEAKRGDRGERAVTLRGLLGRFVDVCNAVAYAHSRGVLHRDLKPGNIMLGPYGETLVVDWGLAKPLGGTDPASGPSEGALQPASASDVTPTRAGIAVGTPAYMAPEQAVRRLDELGSASDVYNLGATLYCLLTGLAPFRGGDAGQILQQVQRGDFPRPREVEPSVPPALETICLKAMALRSRDRYASLRALADDIEHVLADEPVAAYREPLAARLGRWGRHHRTAVTTGAALELRRQLVEADKASALAQRDLAVSYFKLGNLALRNYDFKTAVGWYSQGLEIPKRFSKPESLRDRVDILEGCLRLCRAAEQAVADPATALKLPDYLRRPVLTAAMMALA